MIVLSSVVKKYPGLSHASRQLGLTGKVIFFIFVLASMLLGVQMLVAHSANDSIWPIFNTLVLEAVLAGLFYWTRKNDEVKNLYFACAIANVAVAAVLLVTMLELPLWRKMELAGVGLGLGMTIMAFRAWVQELDHHQRQSSVSPLFLLGSLLICIPLGMVVMSYRHAGQFLVMDEAAMLIMGLFLVAAGCICQLRIPAIAGATLTVLYLGGLLLFFPWGHLGTASLILAGGGASLFLVGLGLSIFRDRLLALPQKVKERRGIFQVLGWR